MRRRTLPVLAPLSLALLGLALVLVAGCAPYAVPDRAACRGTASDAPWDFARAAVGETDGAERTSPAAGRGSEIVGDGLVATYQRHLRRPSCPHCPHCPFSPSCSKFARQAFQRYGALLGFALTFDRLFLRETVILGGNYPTTCGPKGERLHDPIP